MSLLPSPEAVLPVLAKLREGATVRENKAPPHENDEARRAYLREAKRLSRARQKAKA